MYRFVSAIWKLAMIKVIFKEIKRSGPVFGVIATVGGFIGDVLRPIAPFSSYLFFSTAISSLILLIMLVLKESFRAKLIPAFVISLFLMGFSGLIYSLEPDGTENSGVLANTFPGIKNLQSSLGIIQENISAIKESAKRIEESSARTEELVKKVEQNTEENVKETQKVAEAVRESTQSIVGSLQDIKKGFATLTQSGGVIANPERPEQFYHNARVQELGGDYGNARRSYNRYFTFKLNFIDPHLRYQTFLKIQEGKAGAREIYTAMYENDQRPIMEFARIILFDSPKRTEMLEEFVLKNQNFGFAYLELSKEFSELRTGVSTIKNMRKEYDYLDKFMDLYNKGNITRLFLDKARLSELVSTADSRIKILEGSLKKLENPVTVSVYPEIKRHTKTTRKYGKKLEDDKYVDTTILKTVWKISLQIFEDAEDPKIVLVKEESKKPMAVESRSSSGKTSMFHFFIKDEEFSGNSFLTVSYVNSSGDSSGPYKVLLSKEDYIVSFLKKIVADGQDLELYLSKNSAGIPGFPFAHLLDLSQKFPKNYTYLQIAAGKNYIDVAKWLLINGADVNNGYRDTYPLIIAVREGNYDSIKLLVDHGADLNVGAREWGTPLLYASSKPDTELNQKIVKMLVELGAKNCTNEGYTRAGKPDDCNLKGKDLMALDLRKSNLQGVNLKNTSLKGKDLTGADFTGADLSEANLSEANLSGATLNNVKMSEANLSGANLSGANLAGAILTKANLSGANLSGADLQGAKLKDANLTGAKLTKANLGSVTPWSGLAQFADYTGADFTEADLTGAINTNQRCCDWRTKVRLCKTKMPSGKIENRDCK